MRDFFSKLFDTSDFPARWYCGNWSDGEGWLHILSDIGIWSAYTAIPLVLLFFASKRRDFPFTRMFWLFSAFILFCGLTHLLDAVIFWHPIYRVSGLVKLATALISWSTVIALVRIIPGVLHLPSLAANNEQLKEQIDQKAQVERDLRQLQDRYEALLSGTRSIVWSTNGTGHFAARQISWERFTGHSADDYLGKVWFYSMHPDDIVGLERQWHETQLTTKSFRAQGRLWHSASGSYRPCVVEAVPVRDSRNQVTEWVGTINDVHEQRLAEDALRTAEADANRQKMELELIYDTAPVGMSLIDREHRFLRVNTHLANLHGRRREEHLGRVAHELMPELGRTLRPLYDQVFASGQTVSNIEIHESLSESGDNRCWLVSLHPLSNDTSGVWGVSAIIQDISERKQMEQALRESERQALQANLAKSEFLANMSHEIRTPMAAILGYADVLLGHLEDPDNRTCVMIIKRNGEHLLNLINDILDLSRIEAGRLDVTFEAVDLPHLLNDIASLMRVRADEKELGFRVVASGAIPQMIFSDATRLRQILINLLGNALKFTERGEVELSARLVDEGSGASIEFAVRDTGIGMNIEQQSKLFRPFSQGDSSVTRAYGGSGLGLVISQRLVHLLHGELSFESEYGKGSVFLIRLPAGNLQGVPVIQPREFSGELETPHTGPKGRRLNCRVLVVDDRRDVRYISQHFLENAGAHVSTAEDGEQGIALTTHAIGVGQPFDVIVMDMQMPKMDGMQATGQLRKLGVQTPILALTADAMKGDRERYIRGGCDDYLSKPIEQAVLVEMVGFYGHELTLLQLQQRREKLRETWVEPPAPVMPKVP